MEYGIMINVNASVKNIICAKGNVAVTLTHVFSRIVAGF